MVKRSYSDEKKEGALWMLPSEAELGFGKWRCLWRWPLGGAK